MYDSNTASFIFVTSKPMHLAVRLRQIKPHMAGNLTRADLNLNMGLTLKLSTDDGKQYLKQVIPLLAEDNTAVDSFYQDLISFCNDPTDD